MRWAGTAAVALAAMAALVPAAPAAAAGYASSAGPWSAPVGLTDSTGQQSVVDVKAAGDGTVFALWRDRAAGASDWQFQIAVRRAGSGVWGAPHTVFAGVSALTPPPSLVVTRDGHATVAWVNDLSAAVTPVILTSDWDPASAAWSEPELLTASPGLYIGGQSLGAAADGSLTAVWQQADGMQYQVMAATRAAGARTWSVPQQLDAASLDSVYSLNVGVAPDGTAVAAWDRWNPYDGTHLLRTATRLARTARFGNASVLPGTDAHSGLEQVAVSGTDSTVVLWDSSTGDLKSSLRPLPSGNWGTAQTVVSSYTTGDGSGPLIGPNGDITFVWVPWSDTYGTPVVEAVTRTATTGVWGAPRILSTGYVNWHVSASIGGDGTVQALWTQTPSIENGNDNYLEWSVRSGGAWSTAKALNATPVPAVPSTDALAGKVAAGPDGRATAVWIQALYSSPGSYSSQVLTQYQTLVPKPVFTAAARITGAARTGSALTCAASWHGTGVSVSRAWLRDGKPITGATTASYVLTAADYGHKAACRITVANGAGSASSVSAPLTVAAGPAPKATKAPTLSGSPRVGGKLSAAHGTWSPAPTSYGYVWKRNGKPISGANRSTYTLAKADKGGRITVTVTVSRAGYAKGTATSSSVTCH
ncbi:hypothetical protein ACFO3J_23600 [Streptomyces polygonati]|uniref:Ig-like domain-containing protein n=1 Tax=Streptomyces polygonati TaxID=1617087 RepID=A0ABV8HR01_9ACTN